MHPLMVLLDQLHQTLDDQGLWQSAPIDPEALNSQEPFCVDTLSFHQWLQFVLIPRLTALVEGGWPLPQGSNMAAMAEVAFSNQPSGPELIRIIQDIDAMMGGAET